MCSRMPYVPTSKTISVPKTCNNRLNPFPCNTVPKADTSYKNEEGNKAPTIRWRTWAQCTQNRQFQHLFSQKRGSDHQVIDKTSYILLWLCHHTLENPRHRIRVPGRETEPEHESTMLELSRGHSQEEALFRHLCREWTTPLSYAYPKESALCPHLIFPWDVSVFKGWRKILGYGFWCRRPIGLSKEFSTIYLPGSAGSSRRPFARVG